MSIYTQLEADNRADRDLICLVQTMAYQLKAQKLSDYGKSIVDDIIKKCELRLSGDRRLVDGAIVIDINDVKEWNPR